MLPQNTYTEAVAAKATQDQRSQPWKNLVKTQSTSQKSTVTVDKENDVRKLFFDL